MQIICHAPFSRFHVHVIVIPHKFAVEIQKVLMLSLLYGIFFSYIYK